MAFGQNTISGEKLRGYIERIENIAAQIKALGDDKKVIKAEAAAAGFDTKTMEAVLKIRKAKPNDLADAEAMLDMYLHALGMRIDPPLFRYASKAGTDVAVREQVIERMRDFVPAHGEGFIDVSWGGRVWRLTRQKDNSVVEAEVVAKPDRTTKAAKPNMDGPEPEPVPDVDEDGAEALGRQYAADNRPVIDNPFPYGDKRRARFDEGWRKQAGGDGMGPDDGE